MALFRNIGAPTTIAPGATHSWTFAWGSGLDVGVVMVTPNLLGLEVNSELVTRDPGVFATAGEELVTHIIYTVRVQNNGQSALRYNLNLGNLL